MAKIKMIAATLCYVRKGGKTLMLHRVKKANDVHEGKWNGLGGKFELGESPEECVVREIREESGLTIIKPDLRGILTFPGFDGEHDWLVFLFTADKFRGKLDKNSNEGNIEWIPDSKLLNLPLWEGDRLFLKWLKNKKFFSAKFIYKKGRLKSYQAVFH